MAGYHPELPYEVGLSLVEAGDLTVMGTAYTAARHSRGEPATDPASRQQRIIEAVAHEHNQVMQPERAGQIDRLTDLDLRVVARLIMSAYERSMPYHDQPEPQFDVRQWQEPSVALELDVQPPEEPPFGTLDI